MKNFLPVNARNCTSSELLELELGLYPTGHVMVNPYTNRRL